MPQHNKSIWLTTIVLGSFSLASATAQVPVRNLDTPNGTFAEPFSNLVGLIELSDGKLIVADRLEKHVSIMDFDRGQLTQLGRTGSGPGEYDSPSGLLPLPNDGFLLTDIPNQRLTFYDREGGYSETMPFMTGTDGAFTIFRPTASDARGRLYHSTGGSVIMTSAGVQQGQGDSIPVTRTDPSDKSVDTVAYLAPPPPRPSNGTTIQAGGGASIRLGGAMYNPFSRSDDWEASRDGRVAVARYGEYRIDWYNADGRLQTRGPVIAHEPIPINTAEKEAWAESQASSGGGATMAVMAIGAAGGGRSESFSVPAPNIDEVTFPETKPAFYPRSMRIAANGEVWLRRYQRHDREDRALYDVFDGNGRLVRQVRLAPNRRLVGFGAGVAYTLVNDEDDLQWLERHAYPQ